MDKLEEIFRMQSALNARIGVNLPPATEEEKTKWILNYTRAMQQETAELIDSVPWKWWAKYQKFDEQNAKVEVVDLASRSARVTVPDYQLSLAIGREGQNARLAARLTGWRIDIRSDAAGDAPGAAAGAAGGGAPGAAGGAPGAPARPAGAPLRGPGPRPRPTTSAPRVPR